jgi:hypothetical protein
MKKLISALIFALLLSLPLPASAAQLRDFSADFIERDGEEVLEGKIFFTKDMSRYETPATGEVLVTRRDKKVMWLIFPRERKYCAMPYEFEYDPVPQPKKETGDLKRKFLCHETVDTFRLKKYLVTVKYFFAGEAVEDRYYEWYRSDFPFPVKTESEGGGSSFEYKNIKFAKQNPSLFAEPKSYEKVSEDEIPAPAKAAPASKKRKK